MDTLNKLAEMRLQELRQYILPAISEYITNTYDINISIDELATEALKISLHEATSNVKPTNDKIGSPAVKPTNDKGKCQFILKNSRTRPGSKCGKTTNGNAYFCKHCTTKASFATIAKEISINLGIPYEELTSGVSVVKKDGIEVRAPRVPEKRDKYTAGIDKEEVVEELILTSIEGLLDCFCLDEKTNLVHYYDEDTGDNSIIGKYKNSKVIPLTEREKIKLIKEGNKVGNYDDYDLNKD